MSIEALTESVLALTPAANGEVVPGLRVLKRTQSVGFEAFIYEPLVCLILQGAKETSIGQRCARVTPGNTIVVSHHLPVRSRITDASAASPYVALVTRLDRAELLRMADQIEVPEGDEGTMSAFHLGPVDAPLFDVFRRYVGLAHDPARAALVPLIRQELHIRLLSSAPGRMLRRVLQRGSHAHDIARAIQTLRSEYRQRIEMDTLAQSVGMSPSSFYAHFKSITATTPLQYQKHLRLTEARRLLQGGDHTVATAAFEVGYESASQFSREYARAFGGPPSQDRRASASST